MDNIYRFEFAIFDKRTNLVLERSKFMTANSFEEAAVGLQKFVQNEPFKEARLSCVTLNEQVTKQLKMYYNGHVNRNKGDLKMKAKPAVIRVSCATNDDFNGVWYKEDVNKELDELGFMDDSVGQAERDFYWMDYVFGHLFSDEPNWTQDLNDTFTQLDEIREITVKLSNDLVKIEKLYYKK